MNNFFEMFKLAKESDDIKHELALFNAVNESSSNFGKAQFDAGYDLGFRHGETGKVKPLHSEAAVTLAKCKTVISEILKLSEDAERDGETPLSSYMEQILNEALES